MQSQTPTPISTIPPNFQSTTSPQSPQKNASEFICPCSKAYKSYAAIYTHIKNKHKDQGQYYKANMKRPVNSNGVKGRPRKTSAFQLERESQRMTILEIANLEFWEKLKQVTHDNPALGLNQQYSEEKIKSIYTQLTKKYGYPLRNILEPMPEPQPQISTILQPQHSSYPTSLISSTSFTTTTSSPSSPSCHQFLKQFYTQFCKHTKPSISARVLWTLNTFDVETRTSDSLDMIEIIGEDRNRDVQREIWFDIQGMGKFIFGVFEDWSSC